MNNYLKMKVSDFYDIDNKYVYTKIKNMIAPVICFVERNLNEVCYKINGTGTDFKKHFNYISEKLDQNELDQFVRLYKKIRSINVHARTFYSKEDMWYSFDFSKLLSEYDFMGIDVPFSIDNELTIYGVFGMLNLFLSKDQSKYLLDRLSEQKYFTLPQEYKTYEKKKEIITKNEFLTNIRKEDRDLELIYCAEQYFVAIVAEFFLILEEDIFKNNAIVPTQNYFPFPVAQAYMHLDKSIKDKMNNIRKMWAHGNCFYYTSETDNLIYDFLELMNSLLPTQYSSYAYNVLNKIKRTLLNLKYKRPVEMVLRLQTDRYDKEALIDRLNKMTNFEDRDKRVPFSIERKLSQFDLTKVAFYYQNKEIKFDNYWFSSIETIEHRTSRGTLIVEGFDTGLSEFKEYHIPEYPALSVKNTIGGQGVRTEKVESDYRKCIRINYEG